MLYTTSPQLQNALRVSGKALFTYRSTLFFLFILSACFAFRAGSPASTWSLLLLDSLPYWLQLHLCLGLPLDSSFCESLEPQARTDTAQTKPIDSELTEIKNPALESNF